jgi:integrase
MRLYDKPDSPYKFYDFHLAGKRYRGSTEETTLKAAMKMATDYRDKLAAGDPSTRRSRKAPTLQQFGAEFLTWCENSGSIEPNTVRYYTYGVRLLDFSELADVPIDQIDSKLIDVVKFMRPIIDRRSGKQTGEWVACGKSYTQQAQRTLRVMLSRAAEWKMLDARVTFHIGKTPGRDGQITPEIETIILRELSGYRTKRPWLVIVTMMDCGARPSEVFEMRLENIDWAGRRIKITDGKTDNAKRWVVMSERMHRELSLWCNGDEGPGWLFPSRTSGSKHGHLNSINHSFKSACERGGLNSKLVPYLSRHTFGTYAMLETGNPFMVAGAMGHGSAEAMSPYQHQPLAPLTAAINKRNAAAAIKTVAAS